MTAKQTGGKEPSRLQGDINGGMTGALLSVSTTIGFGLILFAPFGAAGIGAGIAVMLIGQALGGAVGVATSGTRGLSLGVTSALLLLLSGLVSTVAADHPGPGTIGFALAAVAIATVLSGLLVMLAGALGAGKIIPLVPYPVLAGIVNGTAVLLIVSMTWKALGPGPGDKPGLWLPVAPLVTATVVWLIYFGLPARLAGTRIAKIPTMLLAIVAGTAVHHLLALIIGLDRAGPMLGAMPSVAAGAGNLGLALDGLKHLDPRQLAPQIAPVAISMAVVTMIETLAAVSALQDNLGRVVNPRRDLISTGLRLVDLDGLRSGWRALRQGGRHKVDVLCSALVILAVAGVAIKWSLVAAVAVGIPLSVVVFVAAMGRDLVRRVYRNPIGRSRLRWPEHETTTLIANGERVAVIEIEGAIFFGSVDAIARRIEAERQAGADYLVLDVRRIASIDLSGARRLVQICNRLWTDGVHLSLAYVRPGMPVWDYLEELSLLARLRKAHVFPSLDAALEAVETALLAESGAAATDALTPEAALRGLGLPDDAVAALLPHLTEVHFEPGDLAIRAGEDANSVYLLLSGRLDVTIPLAAASAANALRTRLTTITSGTLVGEMALLSGAARSADVVARTASVCLRFDAETVAALRRDRPEVAYHLLTCIALQIDRNLRLANMTIASLEG